MGFFSFITTNTKESIPNEYSNRDTKIILMIDNKGTLYVSHKDYQGYGIFGGKDIYELIAEMNGYKGNNTDELRNKGIDLHFQKRNSLLFDKTIYPNLIEVSQKEYSKIALGQKINPYKWQNVPLLQDSEQGYFYPSIEVEEEDIYFDPHC